jgi:hypothetical protein
VDEDEVDVAEVEVGQRLLHGLDDVLPVQSARLAAAEQYKSKFNSSLHFHFQFMLISKPFLNFNFEMNYNWRH